jgi:hypothetical protein
MHYVQLIRFTALSTEFLEGVVAVLHNVRVLNGSSARAGFRFAINTDLAYYYTAVRLAKI